MFALVDQLAASLQGKESHLFPLSVSFFGAPNFGLRARLIVDLDRIYATPHEKLAGKIRNGLVSASIWGGGCSAEIGSANIDAIEGRPDEEFDVASTSTLTLSERARNRLRSSLVGSQSVEEFFPYVQEAYLGDSAELYRRRLLSIFAALTDIARLSQRDGTPPEPWLDALATYGETSPYGLDGLEPVLIFLLDEAARRPPGSPIAYLTILQRLAQTMSTTTPQSAVAAYPHFVPIGRSLSSVAVHVRADVVIILAKAGLNHSIARLLAGDSLLGIDLDSWLNEPETKSDLCSLSEIDAQGSEPGAPGGGSQWPASFDGSVDFMNDRMRDFCDSGDSNAAGGVTSLSGFSPYSCMNDAVHSSSFVSSTMRQVAAINDCQRQFSESGDCDICLGPLAPWAAAAGGVAVTLVSAVGAWYVGQFMDTIYDKQPDAVEQREPGSQPTEPNSGPDPEGPNPEEMALQLEGQAEQLDQQADRFDNAAATKEYDSTQARSEGRDADAEKLEKEAQRLRKLADNNRSVAADLRKGAEKLRNGSNQAAPNSTTTQPLNPECDTATEWLIPDASWGRQPGSLDPYINPGPDAADDLPSDIATMLNCSVISAVPMFANGNACEGFLNCVDGVDCRCSHLPDAVDAEMVAQARAHMCQRTIQCADGQDAVPAGPYQCRCETPSFPLPDFAGEGSMNDMPRPGFPLSPRGLDLSFGSLPGFERGLGASGTTALEGVMGQAVRTDMESMQEAFSR